MAIPGGASGDLLHRRQERSPNIDIVHELCRQVGERFDRNPDLKERFPDCPSSRGEDNASLITYVTDRPGHDSVMRSTPPRPRRKSDTNLR